MDTRDIDVLTQLTLITQTGKYMDRHDMDAFTQLTWIALKQVNTWTHMTSMPLPGSPG